MGSTHPGTGAPAQMRAAGAATARAPPPADRRLPPAVGWQQDEPALERWIAAARKAALSPSTPRPRHCRLSRRNSWACRWGGPGQACYIPVGHVGARAISSGRRDRWPEGQMALKEVLALLKPLLEDPGP